MAGGKMTKRQKDISRLMRERRELFKDRLETFRANRKFQKGAGSTDLFAPKGPK